MNKKLTFDEIYVMVGILGLHFMTTQSITVASVLAGKAEKMENEINKAMELGRTLVRDILDAAGDDDVVMAETKTARAYFGTPKEHEAKRAAARAAYHQRELTKQPG